MLGIVVDGVLVGWNLMTKKMKIAFLRVIEKSSLGHQAKAKE